MGGKHVLTTTWYAWDISAARSSQVGQIGDRTASFNADGLPTSSCQYDLANTKSLYLPQWTPACFTEAYTDQSNFPLHRMQINHGLTAQLNLQGTGAAAKRYHLGSHLSTIEIGGKFRNASATLTNLPTLLRITFRRAERARPFSCRSSPTS